MKEPNMHHERIETISVYEVDSKATRKSQKILLT